VPDATKPASTEAPPTTATATAPAAKTADVPAEKKLAGRSLASFADLNALAANTNAVFIFVPAKTASTDDPPSAPMESAAKKIREQGYEVGLFSLEKDSRDYDRIATQMSVPGVVVMVKGKGMSAVSNEITESKLMQGFVTAFSAGGCGPSSGGCGPSGCR
jgi:hypothetical protein